MVLDRFDGPDPLGQSVQAPDWLGTADPGPAIVLAPFTDQPARGASPLKPRWGTSRRAGGALH